MNATDSIQEFSSYETKTALGRLIGSQAFKDKMPRSHTELMIML